MSSIDKCDQIDFKQCDNPRSQSNLTKSTFLIPSNWPEILEIMIKWSPGIRKDQIIWKVPATYLLKTGEQGTRLGCNFRLLGMSLLFTFSWVRPIDDREASDSDHSDTSDPIPESSDRPAHFQNELLERVMMLVSLLTTLSKLNPEP